MVNPADIRPSSRRNKTGPAVAPTTYLVCLVPLVAIVSLRTRTQSLACPTRGCLFPARHNRTWTLPTSLSPCSRINHPASRLRTVLHLSKMHPCRTRSCLALVRGTRAFRGRLVPKLWDMGNPTTPDSNITHQFSNQLRDVRRPSRPNRLPRRPSNLKVLPLTVLSHHTWQIQVPLQVSDRSTPQANNSRQCLLLCSPLQQHSMKPNKNGTRNRVLV